MFSLKPTSLPWILVKFEKIIGHLVLSMFLLNIYVQFKLKKWCFLVDTWFRHCIVPAIISMNLKCLVYYSVDLAVGLLAHSTFKSCTWCRTFAHRRHRVPAITI